jgi:hypothetical protein
MADDEKKSDSIISHLDPSLLRFAAEGFAAPVGLALRSGGGWEYLRFRVRGKAEEILSGKLEFRGFTGILSPPRFSRRVAAGTLRALSGRRPGLGLRIDSWIVEDLCFQWGPAGWAPAPEGERARELRMEDLEGEAWEALVADEARSYYWSERFDSDFYVAQARAGCIAIASDRGDRVFLMPELQNAYAVLDWKDLRAGKGTSRLLRPERLADLGAELRVSSDVTTVLDALDERWKGETWLFPPYRALMASLPGEKRKDFALRGVELRAGGELVAGELGYSMGKTYTSLTGFFRRDRPEWSGLGIVQLHLLARRLESEGYAFWNLGHPYMQYKLDLGARIIPRREFLERWKAALRGEAATA